MSLANEPIVIGHDPYDGRQIALSDTTLILGHGPSDRRRVISLEVGQERSVELDAEARRNLVKHLTDIDDPTKSGDPIDGLDDLARAVGILPEPITATRDGGGSR